MSAIFKRELKGYFTSPLGIVYITVMLIIYGLLFAIMNLLGLSADTSALYWTASYALIPAVAILTMHLFADDRQNGTDKLLLSAPVYTTDIVLGKFFAVFIFASVPVIITLLYPIILLFFKARLSFNIIFYVVSYLIFSAATFSLGTLISALTKNQAVAAVLSFVVMLAVFFIQAANSFISSTVVVKVLNWFSIARRFQIIALGVFDVNSIIYLLTFTTVILSITAMVIEKKRWS